MNPQDWIPDHQSGFRQAHSTVQSHRITDVINKAMEKQKCCTAALLVVSQAFDKVWHPGLLFKIKRILPSSYFNLLKLYLNERQFETKFNAETSSRFHIHSGVPQRSTLGPLLYVLYTSDLPTSRETILGTFADDTTIFVTHEDSTITSPNLQEHLHIIEKWLQKRKIKFNECKSSHIKFTIRKGHCPAVNISQTVTPQTEAVQYLGLHFDCKLNWKEHIVRKRKQIDLKTQEINWLIGNPHLSIWNKWLIYKAVIKPTWSYGI